MLGGSLGIGSLRDTVQTYLLQTNKCIILLQLGSVVLVITGITLFAYADGFEGTNAIGVVLSVGSAIGAAFYKVCYIL